MRAALAIALLGAGCYSADVGPCVYSCAADGVTCPSGLVCTDEHMCAATKTDHCDSPAIDARDDSPDSDAPCPWEVSNVNACIVGAFDSNLIVHVVAAGAQITADATGATINPPVTGLQFVKVQQPLGPDIWVLPAKSITIDGPLMITSTLPIAMLAGTEIHINSSIDWKPTTNPNASLAVTCSGVGEDGGTSSGSSGGGGGGGFGRTTMTVTTSGAPGGNGLSAMGTGGAGGELDGRDELVPLRGGCRGGRGGDVGTTAGAAGGDGGGALEIAARERIAITGTISVPGGGGNLSMTGRGAGGGGAGGAILLEAPDVMIEPSGALCANGGGGGGTGQPATNGGDGLCGFLAAPGGSASGTGAKGGDGAFSTLNATPGKAPVAVQSSGSGGGGGVGRIRINSTNTLANGSTITPKASAGGLP